MKSSFLFFCVVVILGFIAGYYYHEASDEKIRYEREQCYQFIEKYRTGKIDNISKEYAELMINNTGEHYAYAKK